MPQHLDAVADMRRHTAGQCYLVGEGTRLAKNQIIGDIHSKSENTCEECGHQHFRSIWEAHERGDIVEERCKDQHPHSDNWRGVNQKLESITLQYGVRDRGAGEHRVNHLKVLLIFTRENLSTTREQDSDGGDDRPLHVHAHIVHCGHGHSDQQRNQRHGDLRRRI